ncbi:MAG TPA: replicative DNA helicase, partial [Candidatus Aminicenantes bacterium]|nr:replicative DNA helicase [Candidatus Aminicenantes bacterium]
DLARALPHDETAERAVLGAMLRDSKYVQEVFSEIDSDDFYRNAHRVIAGAVSRLADQGKPCDIVMVSSALENSKELKFAGGRAYIATLIDDVPDEFDISEYLKIIKDRSGLRRIILASMGVIQRGSEPAADTQTLLSEIESTILQISEKSLTGGFSSSEKLIPETLDHIERIQRHGESEGIKTGYTGLDDKTSGFQKSDLIVIAARPSMGKTALALNIALHMAVREGKTIAFFSIEMSRTQIAMRLLATHASIPMSTLRTGKPRLSPKEWGELELAASEIKGAKLFIDDSSALSIIEMKTRCRQLDREHKLDAVFVDYLQLMKVTGEQLRRNDSRAQEVAIITASLKELAKELQIPVIALAQLNRSPETRQGKRDSGPRYQLSDLKESGSIEQDADLVIFLHREEQINHDTERKGEADVLVAKQRNGPTGRVVLAYLDKFTKFRDADFSNRDYD